MDIKSCQNCKHYHFSKDVEYEINLSQPKYSNNPQPTGKYQENVDMAWCEISEVEGDDFTILKYGRLDEFFSTTWFPQLAKVCENYKT